MTFLESRHIHDPVELAEGPWSNQSQCPVTDGDRDLPIKILKQLPTSGGDCVSKDHSSRFVQEQVLYK